jgi:hypothetical protein
MPEVDMQSPRVVIARIYEHIEPLDRGERYEDPLDVVLASRGFGRVTGGGSQLKELGEIEFADIELELFDVDDALTAVADALESAGAPAGSELIDATDNRTLREFGTQQCLAIYLDGASLPADVYAELDFEVVVGQIAPAAGDQSYHGFWQGPEETGVFFFGPDAEQMWMRVEPVLKSLPIGQNARVVIRSGKQGLNPLTVRMPRH